jgi:hypothetical protein
MPRMPTRFPDVDLIRKRATDEIKIAIAQGGDSDDPLFYESLKLPEDGSKDFIPFEPSQVRIKRGRIKLPGLGWVQVDGLTVPPPGARLRRVEVRPEGASWNVHIELETES